MDRSSRLRIIRACATVLVWSGTVAALTTSAAAQTARIEVIKPVQFDVSPPLWSIKPIPPPAGPVRERPEHELPPWINKPPVGTSSLGKDVERHVLQTWPGAASMPAPTKNYKGIGSDLSGFTVNSAPPDTEGDVGPTHYVQWVNSSFAVFRKSDGAVLYGPAAGNTLWSGFGGGCQTNNDGDPIVQYDQLADRWIMAQFSVSTTPYLECIAVSQTSDPTGSYYRYAFSFGSNFNDYPKFGVWPDGYYATYNMFGATSFLGGEVCAYDRAKMLVGNAGATAQCTAPDPSYGGLLPADLDGSAAPPAGSPNFVVTYSGSLDSMLLWKYHVNWTTPGNSTFTGPTVIPVTPYTLACLGYYREACIPQPGTTTKLEALSTDMMYRLAYRNLPSYESLLVNHTVQASGVSALRWYEIRSPNGTPYVAQSGTYQPDANYRWMGSIAMDRAGNVALGASVSNGTSIYPSMFYTGRAWTDPAGVLNQGEVTLQAGGGSQTTYGTPAGPLRRWGDYSTMSIDPSDDCTFWYTNEYLGSSGTFNWRTRIGAFTFPGCTCAVSAPGSPSAVADGDNRITVTWSAVSGATEYRVYRSTVLGGPYSLIGTAPSSPYSDATVTGGVTYHYVVRAYNACESVNLNEVSALAQAGGACDLPPLFAGIDSVATPLNSTCSLELSWLPATSTCGGAVRYDVYRSTSPSFVPGASNRIASNFSDTSYVDSSGLAYGTTYSYVVRAVDAGNGSQDGNTVVASGTPAGPSPTSLYAQGFESCTGVCSWGRAYYTGNANDWRGVMTCPPAHGGTKVFHYGGSGTVCTTAYTANRHALAWPPVFTVAANASGTSLSFYHRYQFQSGQDGAYMSLSFDGAAFTPLPSSFISGTGYTGTISDLGIPGWTGQSTGYATGMVNSGVDLDAACNYLTATDAGCAGKTLYVAFTAYANGSTNQQGWYLDDVSITTNLPGSCSNPPSNVPFFTARATSTLVKLEWLNPSVSYTTTRICKKTGDYPNSPTDAAATCINAGGTAGHYGSTDDDGTNLGPIVNGTPYYYAAYVSNGGVYSSGRRVKAVPFSTSGAAKWAYSTGATALAPPGILPGALNAGAVFGVSNDRILHGMRTTSAGGDWPETAPFNWTPAAMNGPAQGRPPIVPTTVGGASNVVFVGSQDGYAYAFNAADGTSLWTTPSPLGEVVQAGVAAMLKKWRPSLTRDLLFVGSRSAASSNTLWALDPTNGNTLSAWSFDNVGGVNGIGIISSAASVDYAGSRVFFASRARGGGSSDTVWCLSVGIAGVSKVWSANVSDVDGSPVLWNGRLYVGNNAGQVYALDPATGTPLWGAPFATSDGPVKGYLWPQGTTSPNRFYFSTTNKVWAIDDLGGTPQQVSGWPVATIGNPSTPLFLLDRNALIVGASNGRLYRIDTTNPASITSLLLESGSAQIGSPAFDSTNNMALAGSASGVVYAVDMNVVW